ncbi:hypothetical protein HELRODRAFT_172728 [Helobdella robusta]|uniref:Uncharacterized protein n=1 Tax=Helobdella robusta TaxID=6412 RepID=T1F5V3_HELRO|nr:hypothetical protein HELRODRAFT_172728 [Helobdella robusta]ESO04363.1 hypothetical protein HELRODRAFT_172728 [Helobdella robusta]
MDKAQERKKKTATLEIMQSREGFLIGLCRCIGLGELSQLTFNTKKLNYINYLYSTTDGNLDSMIVLWLELLGMALSWELNPGWFFTVDMPRIDGSDMTKRRYTFSRKYVENLLWIGTLVCQESIMAKYHGGGSNAIDGVFFYICTVRSGCVENLLRLNTIVETLISSRGFVQFCISLKVHQESTVAKYHGVSSCAAKRESHHSILNLYNLFNFGSNAVYGWPPW